MNESTLTIGSFLGIPIKLHWTFSLLIIYVIYEFSYSRSYNFIAILFFLLACVLFHELGHALAAKRYKVKTRDIILSPLGGVARLENMPETPKHEFVIALAGPLVNFFLFLSSWLILALVFNQNYSLNFNYNYLNTIPDYLKLSLNINFILFGFNLLPAFPLDGGRILRAMLAINFGRSLATKIAGTIGRILAASAIIYSIYSFNYLFAIAGLYLFYVASAEINNIVSIEKLQSCKVAEFVKTQFTKLKLDDKMEVAIDLLKRNGECNFVVFDNFENHVGSLSIASITEACHSNAQEQHVSKWLDNKNIFIQDNMYLKDALEAMNKNDASLVVIKNDKGNVIGIIDIDTIKRAISLM